MGLPQTVLCSGLGAFCIFKGMKFHYVYVLYSLKDNKLYIGYSTDVYRRLDEHNAGENTSTKYRRPFKEQSLYLALIHCLFLVFCTGGSINDLMIHFLPCEQNQGK